MAVRYLIGAGDPELALIFPQLSILGFNLDRDGELIKEWCESGTACGNQLAILAHAKLVRLGFFCTADPGAAIAILEHHSSPTYLPAAYFLARLYFDADPANIDSVDKSASQMQALVEMRYPAAVCTFAFSLLDGGSYANAEILMSEAADLGAPEAMYWVANSLLQQNEPIKLERGIQLLVRAADANYAPAWAMLADIYSTGAYGAEVDTPKAKFCKEMQVRLGS